MRKTFSIFILLCSAFFSCQAARPTNESVEALIEASNIEKVLDIVYSSVEQSMRQGMARSNSGQPISAEKQRFLDAAATAFAGTMREELSWAKLKPIYVAIYQDNFTQEEIDGLVVFYRSPVGLALLSKMPAVMQQAQLSMQSRVQPMMDRMKAATEKALKDAQAVK